jgi:hypothetical protein
MKIYLTLLALVIILFSSCTNSPYPDKKITLKVGCLEITKYEFEKNKTRDLVVNGTDSSALFNSTKLAVWKKNYINKCMIIADAYSKQYDTIKSIQKSIKHVGNYMMVQRYGYLWKQTISPIVDANKVVTDEKIEKRKKLFYFDYVASKNIEELVKLTNPDTLVQNNAEFLNLKNQYPQNKAISTGYFSSQWPFLAFWKYRDYIFNMKEGSVSKLFVFEDNYMYLYLDHIEEITITEKEKANLLTELQLGTEEELIKKGTVEMEAKCRPKLNQTNLNIIGQFLAKGNSISEFKNDIELIQFYINDTLMKIGTKDFIDYYSNLVVRDEIRDTEKLISYLNEFYGDKYLINEAKKLNLFNSDIFKLDQKNYQNNVFFGKYLEDEILKDIKVDSAEITKYFLNNKANFKQPKTIVASMYLFNKSADASIGANKIAELLIKKESAKTHDSTIINGLCQFIPNVKIDLENPEPYSEEFINTLITTPVGRIAQRSVVHQNKYVVLFKIEESGESYKKLKDVSNYIEYQIKAEKGEIKRQTLVSQLKTRYKVEIDKTGIPD